MSRLEGNPPLRVELWPDPGECTDEDVIHQGLIGGAEVDQVDGGGHGGAEGGLGQACSHVEAEVLVTEDAPPAVLDQPGL